MILSSFLFFLQTNAQIPFFGGCPSATAENDFDIKGYLGIWYEISAYPAIFSIATSCTQAEYLLLPNNSIQVNNTALQFGHYTNIIGNAIQPELAVGELIVNFPSTGQPSK